MMRFSPPMLGKKVAKKWPRKVIKITVLMVAVAVLAGVGYGAWRYYDSHYGASHKKAQSAKAKEKKSITSVSTEEIAFSQQTDSLIKSGDFVQYQNSQLFLVSGYMTQNDYPSA